MVDREALSARLSALESWVADLRQLGRTPRDEFIVTPSAHLVAERLLHLSCECVADIANHLIADHGWRQPQTNRDAIRVLAENGILDEELAWRLERWMGFRNALVHLYLGLDHGRVHDVITSDLGDLEEFARAMAPLLDEA